MLAYNDQLGESLFLRTWMAHQSCDVPAAGCGNLITQSAELNFVSSFIARGATVVDVGAHQGLFTLLAAKRVGSHGAVLAFEPSKRDRRRLKFNLLLNRAKFVKVSSLALGSKADSAAVLYVSQGTGTGCNSLRYPSIDDQVTKELVRVDTLDSVLTSLSIDEVDFIKIDAEGAELDILKGSTRILERSYPMLLCELEDTRTEPWGYKSSEIYEYADSLGYCWYSVSRRGWLTAVPRKDNFSANLIAVHESKLASVSEYVER